MDEIDSLPELDGDMQPDNFSVRQHVAPPIVTTVPTLTKPKVVPSPTVVSDTTAKPSTNPTATPTIGPATMVPVPAAAQLNQDEYVVWVETGVLDKLSGILDRLSAMGRVHLYAPGKISSNKYAAEVAPTWGVALLMHARKLKRNNVNQSGSRTIVCTGGTVSEDLLRAAASNTTCAVSWCLFSTPNNLVPMDEEETLTFAEYYELMTGRPTPPSNRFVTDHLNRPKTNQTLVFDTTLLTAHAPTFYDRALSIQQSLTQINTSAANTFLQCILTTLFQNNSRLPFITIL